jgi:hypothetical protein
MLACFITLHCVPYGWDLKAFVRFAIFCFQIECSLILFPNNHSKFFCMMNFAVSTPRGIFEMERRSGSYFSEGRKLEQRSRTFFPGIDVTNTSPSLTEFWVALCSGTYFL